MLVHHRVTPSNKFAGAHLYTWVERGTTRVKCLSQEKQHNVPGQASNPGHLIQRQSKCTNHEATTPPILFIVFVIPLPLTCWTSCFSIFAHNCCISIVTTSLSLSSTIFDWSCFSITKQFGHLPCNIKYRKQISCDCRYCETQTTMNTRNIYGMSFFLYQGKN